MLFYQKKQLDYIETTIIFILHYVYESVSILISFKRFCFCLLMAITLNIFYFNRPILASYDKKQFYVTNVAFPALMGGIRAYYEGTNIFKAILQGATGGYLMVEGLKGIAKAEVKSSSYAWGHKLLFNFGASVADSAGRPQMEYKMDVGPVWIIAKDNKLKFKLGINAVIVPLIHVFEGSKFDSKLSLKYGTLAFKRKKSKDGTLLGTSALAYSNANVITTNIEGDHAGHELIHTFQYRRADLSPLKLSNIIPRFEERFSECFGNCWYDDTGWAAEWGLQCGWADINHKNKSFDIPFEKEAYWVENTYLHNLK